MTPKQAQRTDRFKTSARVGVALRVFTASLKNYLVSLRVFTASGVELFEKKVRVFDCEFIKTPRYIYVINPEIRFLIKNYFRKSTYVRVIIKRGFIFKVVRITLRI